jgi:hypothetical protein
MSKTKRLVSERRGAGIREVALAKAWLLKLFPQFKTKSEFLAAVKSDPVISPAVLCSWLCVPYLGYFVFLVFLSRCLTWTEICNQRHKLHSALCLGECCQTFLVLHKRQVSSGIIFVCCVHAFRPRSRFLGGIATAARLPFD